MMDRLSALASVLALAFALTACSGDDLLSPPDAGRISLSVVVPTSSSGLASVSPAFDLEQTDGTNTLVLEEVQLVVREVELEGDDDECEEDSDDSGDSEDDSDDCEEFEAGPFLVDLPLDGQVETILAIDVPAGTYDELEFEIHKPEDDDQGFVNDNPAFAEISIRVRGLFNGEPFEFTQDLDEEQEVELSPPLVVEDGAQPTNITLAVDVATWFVGPDGKLIDPSTANDDGPNEGIVEDNIQDSIEGFEDEDEDGEDDHDDDDDDDD
jgi:hypothetical protein